MLYIVYYLLDRVKRINGYYQINKEYSQIKNKIFLFQINFVLLDD